MSSHRFSTGKRFEWDGKAYEVKRILPEGNVNFEELSNGTVRIESVDTLIEALFMGDLRFTAPSLTESKKNLETLLDLSDYPKQAVAAARLRFEIIRPLLVLSPKERTPQAIQARVDQVRVEFQNYPEKWQAMKGISRRSIFRWIQAYQQGGNDLRTLISQYASCGGKGQTRLREEVANLIDSVIKDCYYRPERVTIDDLLGLVAARLSEENQLGLASDKMHMPSRATVSRRVNALDMRERFEAKQGKRSAKREFEQIGQTDYPSLPLERVEIDHTRIDLIVVDEDDNLPLGRPTLTYCLDAATRYPLGYYLGFEPASYYTVMECLYHAICPKPAVTELYGAAHEWRACGIPVTLVTDNGKEFIGQDLNDACELLGIVLVYSPVKVPEFKAGVERQFGTLNSGLFHTIPGTTFSNIFMRGGYDSIGRALISLSEIDQALNIFLVDIYAERFHSGLQGIPARRWENAAQSVILPRLPTSQEEIRILLGRTDHRVIQRYGIKFKNLRYNNDELGPLRVRLQGKVAKIKYHPADLSFIHAYDPFEKRYIRVDAIDQDYTCGLSLWKHQVILNFARQEQKKVDLAALGRAKQKIQMIVDTARHRKKTKTRSRIARWDRSGKSLTTDPQPSSSPSQIPALQASSMAKQAEANTQLALNNEVEGWEIISNGLLKAAQVNSHSIKPERKDEATDI